MRRISDDTPHWVGFGVQQELADELLLAEVVKEVVLTLRSRGVSHNQSMIEAYHTACDLIRQQPSPVERSPLAQITTALHIFCLASPPSAGNIPALPQTDPTPSPESVIQEDIASQLSPAETKRTRGKHRRQRFTDNTITAQRRAELHTMPYLEYLQTPEWQARRKIKLKQADYRCQICYRQDIRLDVHHRTYERRGCEKDQDLVVLCEGCHTLFHQHMQEA